MESQKSASISFHPLHLHDNLLPGRVVRDVADPLLLLWHCLHAFHQFLEQCSLPEKQQSH